MAIFLGVKNTKSWQDAQKTRAKSALMQVHFVVWQAGDMTGDIPGTVTKYNYNGERSDHSWRAVVLLAQAAVIPKIEEYHIDQKWNSPANLECANHVIKWNGNYFSGGANRDFPETVIDGAHILAVYGPNGAWDYDQSISNEEFFDERANRIAFVILPDSKVRLFEPKDVDFKRLKQAVKQHGQIYALTAGNKFVVLREEILSDFVFESR